jgi:hypothetical protein
VTDSSTRTVFAGGCLCGQLRYEASDLIDAGYCHCRLCQRSSGAPVLAWVGVPIDCFSYLQGAPGSHASSSSGRREFCTGCGTPIAFRDERTPERVDVNLANFDDPGVIEPQYHIWVSSQIPWFEIDDDLSRYADGGPDSPDSPNSPDSNPTH